jgi:hypothetical protein
MVKQADVCMLNGLYQQRNMKMKEDEGTLISELLTITALLDGEMQRYETLNSVGRSSKKIVIEYDIEVKEK